MIHNVHDADDGEDESRKIDELQKRPHMPEHAAQEPYDAFDNYEDEPLSDVEFYEGVVLGHQKRNDDKDAKICEYGH